MPTVITRLYEDEETAQQAIDSLVEAEHHSFESEIVKASSKSGVIKKLYAVGQGSIAADAYSKHTGKKRVLVIITAEFSPDGGTRRLIEILDSYPTVDVGLGLQERYVSEETRSTKGKIISDTLFTINHTRSLPNGRIFKNSLARDMKPRVTLMRGKAHVSTKFLPFPLISTPGHRSSAMAGDFHLTSKLGFPLLSQRKG